MAQSFVSRRTALGVLGAGSALAFVGCASNVGSVKPLPTDATASYRSDFSGEAKIDEYDTSAGEYRKATRTERAKNVPKPINLRTPTKTRWQGCIPVSRSILRRPST